MEAAFGVKRCDSEHDGTTETGPLTQSTDESEDISGGVSDEEKDLRADECDGLAGATTSNSGVGCSLADEQVDEKSAWSNDCTGGVSKYRLLDVVEEYVLFRALWHVAAALMTVALRKMNMASLGVEWAKAVGNIALEIKKRHQNKAAYIGCVMTIGVAVSVHGSSFMEATDHLPLDVTGTCTLERTVHFAVSVNDNSLKVNTNTSGSDMDYMALYVPIAPIAPLAIAMTDVDGDHKFAPSEILEIVRAGSETAAGAKGSCAGYRCHRGGRAQDGRRRFFQGRKQKLKRTDR